MSNEATHQLCQWSRREKYSARSLHVGMSLVLLWCSLAHSCFAPSIILSSVRQLACDRTIFGEIICGRSMANPTNEHAPTTRAVLVFAVMEHKSPNDCAQWCRASGVRLLTECRTRHPLEHA